MKKWKTQIDGLSYLKGRGAFMWELENPGKVMGDPNEHRKCDKPKLIVAPWAGN